MTIPENVKDIKIYYNKIKNDYDSAQKKFASGVNDNDAYVRCLKGTSDCLKYIEKCNPFEIYRMKEEVKNIYFIHGELITRTVGLIPGKAKLEERERNVLITALNFINKGLQLEPFSDYKELFKSIIIYVSGYITDYKEASSFLEQGLMVTPNDYNLHFNIAILYHKQNNVDKSLMHFKMAYYILETQIKLHESKPDVVKQLLVLKSKTLNGLSTIYYSIQDRETSKYFLLEGLKNDDNDPDIHNQLGVIYTEMRIIDKAVYHYQRGIDIVKNATNINKNDSVILLSSMYMNMGLAVCYECDFQKAISHYNTALKYNPRLSLAYQNKLLDFNYISHMVEDPMYIAKLHKNINKIYPKVITNWREGCPDYNIKTVSKLNEPVKQKLRIGFVSGDFICHPVSYFINCILKYIDYTRFELHCFSVKIVNLKDQFPNINWHVIRNMGAEQLKSYIQSHNIDILFDLSAHTGDNRLDTFVLKPAPIQISYCGYPGSSGINSMDYHITDRFADKPNFSEKYYSEKLIWMDRSFLCYTPSKEVIGIPKLKEQPIIKNGYITFGTFNRYNKMNSGVLKVWSDILNRIPTSRLVVKTKEFLTDKLRSQFIESFDENVRDRLVILGYSDLYEQHLEDYQKIDISLDTFPYSGTTTSCESLMMGVPVVTLYDNERFYHSQNVTSSLLKNSNLGEFVAFSKEEYIQKCIYYSQNPDSTLKERVQKAFFTGAVSDHQGFVKEFQEKLIDTYQKHF